MAMDHNHLAGDFRGAAHNEYNLNYKTTEKIYLLSHNLKNYDAHLVIHHLGNF